MAADAMFALRMALENSSPNLEDVTNGLNAFCDLTAKGGPNTRSELILAGAYDVICSAWKLYCDSGEFNIRLLTPEAEITRELTLRALWTLTPGHPDIMDHTGFTMIFQAFDPKINEATKIQALKVMRNICIKSEENREALTSEWSIIEPFVNVIKVASPSAELVREWCGALRTFVLNDDRTVAYNRAPERKRMIFDLNGHSYLAQFINDFNDVPTLNAIVNVIGIMASNEDLCVGLEAHGALRGIQTILTTQGAMMDLTKNAISALRYLCISATVREKSEGYDLMKIVLRAVWRYKTDAEFVEIAFSCLSFMTLHAPCAISQLLVERGVYVVTEIMKQHMTAVYVLKGGCLTLRNVASSGGQIARATIIDVKGEELLRQIAVAHKTLIENHINPTLRDLDLTQIPASGELHEIPDVKKIEASLAPPGTVAPPEEAIVNGDEAPDSENAEPGDEADDPN